MSRISLISSAETEPAKAIAAIAHDLQSLALEVGRRRLIHLTGGDRVVIPTAGVVKIYAVSSISTTGSDGSNYFVINGMRNGQAESGVSYDTRNGEITGYSEFFLGVIQAGKGDVLYLQVVATGLIYPILTLANLTIRCEVGPQETIR